METNKQQKTYKITCGPSDKHPSEYKFWLGDLSPKDIQEIVLYIVQEKNPGALRKNVRNLYFDCNIVNNLAKLAIQYDTDKHHTIKCSFDEYGIVEKKYVGFASDCLRGVMSKKFGKLYDYALEDKFGITVAND